MSRRGAGGNGGERSRSRDGSGYDERRFAAALNTVTSASGTTQLHGSRGHCFEFLASESVPVETAKKVCSLLQMPGRVPGDIALAQKLGLSVRVGFGESA